MDKKTYTITTAITYTSGKPHIGNTYEIIMADAIARYKRKMGFDVYFQTGTDEHGQKIELKAAEKGVAPQAFVDDVAGEIKVIWDLMNTTYDKFVRTTDKHHEAEVQKIFKKLYDQGDIYKGYYEGWYCTPCESFFTEAQLVDGKCPDCGREVKLAKEEAYFFKLSKYTDRLIRHIEENPEFIWPESRKREMVNNFLKPGLQDLCVSRTSFKWGIPVTFDDKHVIYVWIDALSNYITFLGYDPDGSSADYQKYWPADLHLIGKDILRFHTLYWPILLMALGQPLPKQIFGHPWLLVGEGKMSKSKGNVIYADDLVHYFGVDAVRYFVLHEMPYAQDGTLTYEIMIERINSDLANILGNLVSRTVAMVNKYFGGIIPAPAEKDEGLDADLISLAMQTPGKMQEKMDQLRIADAMDEVFALLRRSNKYIDETAPWVLAKDEGKKARLGTVLYNLLECIRISAALLEPFLPETAEKIFGQIGADKQDFDSLNGFGGIVPGAKVMAEPEILFARLDPKKKLEEIEGYLSQKYPAKAEKAPEPKQEEQPAEITIDDFAKVDLRVAEVLDCSKVEKADKLLCLKVKVNGQERQVVSGIAKWYRPEDLIGRKIILVANLEAAKLRGLMSQGMILCADVGDHDEARVIFVDGDVDEGSKVR